MSASTATTLLADHRQTLPDVQQEAPAHALVLARVGVCGMKLPLALDTGLVTASLDLSVDLPATQRGAHMSRFRRAIDSMAEGLDPQSFADMLAHELLRVHPYATRTEVSLTTDSALADLVIPSTAVTRLGPAWDDAGRGSRSITLRAFGATVCPCSFAMSDGRYAHVQRAQIQLEVFDPQRTLAELHAICASAFSSPVAMMLNRPAEKALVDRMFAHPRFVEDVAREAVAGLRAAEAGASAKLVATAFESIHPYDCFAAWEGALR